MKKTYIAPLTETSNLELSALMAGSVTSPNGIGYGGVDTDGTLRPGSRWHNKLWEDEDEDDDL